ncbi:hypothetical protein AAFN47_20325 [Hoeflea sp. CAU 1731]
MSDEENFILNLDELGEERVRQLFESNNYTGERGKWAGTWLANKAELRRTEQEKHNAQIVDAAKRSADAAERSAIEAGRTSDGVEDQAKYARRALIVSALALIVAIAVAVFK